MMDRRASSAFLWPALIAGAAVLGIAVQFDVDLAKTGSVAMTVSTMLRFFTIISNLLIAILFSGIAAGRVVSNRPFLTGGAAVMIMLVGVVYGLLLRGLIPLSAGGRFADFLLHTATPILVPAYWLLFEDKGRLGWRHPWAWAAVPLLYLLYALIRGWLSGIYPYPFLDVIKLGGARVAANAAAIAIGFLCASFGLVALDRGLARRSGYRPGAYGNSNPS